MDFSQLYRWRHDHNFHVSDRRSEKRTLRVVLLTVTMMAVEISTGILFGSMALLADGWHMGTHAGAIGITFFAYRYARKHAASPRYSFGTGKVGVLGAYTSAICLAIVALLMSAESFKRLFNPVEIRFTEATIVAAAGLFINILSAFLLRDTHGDHRHMNHHHDHNLRAAYLHVMADALTSVLAITALLLGKISGWIWTDPAMGIAGSVLIFRWAFLLIRDSGGILLDSMSDNRILDEIRKAIESDKDNRITDLHVWKLSSGDMAVVISLTTRFPRPPDHYKEILKRFTRLSHITVEINPAGGADSVYY